MSPFIHRGYCKHNSENYLLRINNLYVLFYL
nr:MAG TPA: hypothetical protein [Caudoviricetes sp.]